MKITSLAIRSLNNITLLYTYTLAVTSRSDIAPVSGIFRTSAGDDTTYPRFSSCQNNPKYPTSAIFGISPTEMLKTLIITLTDKVTQAIRKYYFFDIAANIFQFFLLDGLDAGRQYAIKFLMLDTNAHSGLVNGTANDDFSTPVYDEIPPAIIENTLIEKTDTTAKLQLTTNELLKRLRIRYRVIGTTQWVEQELIPTSLTFDVDLFDLLSGQEYEYQYILDDNSDNQLITEWMKI